MSRFDTDTAGLASLVRRRHPGFIFAELISNAFDQPGTKNVYVQHEPVANRQLIALVVRDDDPTGFEDLRDAYTLYRRTKKRGIATVRGRFNMGEKEFISICEEATITTTIGQVTFKDDDRTVNKRKRTEKGTEIEATVKMTRKDYDRAVTFLEMFIPPDGVELHINEHSRVVGPSKDRKYPHDKWYIVGDFETVLPTEIEDEEGELRKTSRKARVVVSTVPEHREGAWLFEMGIPVCELPDDTWDINIQQKVPLARDRDSVTPGYLQKIRVGVLNNCHEDLDEDDAKEAWVTEAIADDDVDQEAFQSVVTSRFGEDAVIYDPSDVEANATAVAEGHAVIHGGSLPSGAWENNRRFESVPSAGKVFATPKPEFSLDGEDCRVPREKWTDGMKEVVKFVKKLSVDLLPSEMDGYEFSVEMVSDRHNNFAAWYSTARLTFNLRKLGRDWFDLQGNFDRIIDLVIHELGHEFGKSHLSEEYYRGLTRLAARLARLIIENPRRFSKFRHRVEAEATA